MVLVVVALLVGQTSTVAQTAATTFFTTTSTVTTLTTVTSTRTTTSVLSVAIVGNVSVAKLVSQFDVTSLIAAALATIVAGVLGAGVGAFMQSRREGGLLVYGNAVYCKKHGVPVTVTPAGLYCSVHRKVIA